MAKRTFSPRSIFLIVFAVFLLVFGYIFYMEHHGSSNIQSRDPSATLSGLGKAIGVTAETRDFAYADWVMSDGKSVPLAGKQIILGTSGINGLGKYGDLTTDELDKLDATFLTPLANSIKKYYQDNEFVLSEENTSTTPNDLWVITFGYEKDGLYCVSNLAQHSDPFAYLTCGTIDTKQQELQDELSDIYKEVLEREKGTDVPVIFRVSTIDGDFANGSASSIGGYQWIAKMTDGAWKIVWTGNDMPLCSDMEEYSIPKSMYPGCYDPNTQTVIQ